MAKYAVITSGVRKKVPVPIILVPVPDTSLLWVLDEVLRVIV